MMRSLYAAVSGLKNHQIKMDVIGNNIANVNTTAFKRSTVSFATQLSQTLRGASTGTAATTGGTNSVQIGLGSSLSAVAQVMTQGSAASTGINSDLEIVGEGFFILQTGEDDADIVYSRSGGFTKDAAGNLVDAAGAMVLGDDLAPIVIDDTHTSFNINSTGLVTGILTDGTTDELGTIGIATFINPVGLTSLGGNYYKASNNSGEAIYYGASEPYPSGTTVVSGALEMSNVDLSTEFTDMIVAQRGFQANSRVITVSDSLLEELINLKRS